MVLAFKYPGGIEQFKEDLPNDSYKEDEQLASVRFLHILEMDEFLQFVKEQGLHYDKEANYSDDFAVYSFLGFWWKADWLVADLIQCSLKG